MESPTDKTNMLHKIKQLTQTYLDLERWSFQEVAWLESQFPAIIYRSEWCQVKFTWEGQEATGENIINISYGRSHAVFDNSYLTWEGEKCHCWHSAVYVLHFLDGLFPAEVAGRNYQRPKVMEQFRQSEVGKSLRGRDHQPEWLIRLHAAIWNHYGKRFFEVFDLRRPDLWEKYRKFMKDLYDIEGRSPNVDPPLDKIC